MKARADSTPTLGVAIPAAGSGRRAGGRKQYRELKGRPVLLRALQPFLRDPRVEAVAVALPEDDAAHPPPWLTEADPRLRVVTGGDSRTASVAAALRALPQNLTHLAVHDAARPLMGPDVLERCLAEVVAAPDHVDGAVAGWPAVDTVKRVDDDDFVVETPTRRYLRQAQTPQLFRAHLLREAYRRAEAEGLEDTDDAALVARMGGRVRMVRGSRWNLKVTLPEDTVVAEAVLRARPEGTTGWLDALADHVQEGGLLVHPTETVYGLGSRPAGTGLHALLRAKGRGPERPVLLLTADPDPAPGLAWTSEARALADAFWPGPLTLVLHDPENRYPEGVRNVSGGVAVRNTLHPLIRALVHALEEPLTSTSANAPGDPPALRAHEAAQALQGLTGGGASETQEGFRTLDGGPLRPSAPSTLVDCTGPQARVLREGALPTRALQDVVPGIAPAERRS